VFKSSLLLRFATTNKSWAECEAYLDMLDNANLSTGFLKEAFKATIGNVEITAEHARRKAELAAQLDILNVISTQILESNVLQYHAARCRMGSGNRSCLEHPDRCLAAIKGAFPKANGVYVNGKRAKMSTQNTKSDGLAQEGRYSMSTGYQHKSCL